ncbi:MAG: hypothetical protein M3Y55_02470 [Pseudomonadota bacterium]|nr:hypothetical protein [Pseudomonadota bacterium]
MNLTEWRPFAHTEPSVMPSDETDIFGSGNDDAGADAVSNAKRREFNLTLFVRPIVIVALGVTSSSNLGRR